MKSVIEEIKNYRLQALKASAAGDPLLAYQWRMALDQANNFYLQQHCKLPISPVSQTKEKKKHAISFAYHVATAKKEAHSIMQALEALKEKNFSLATTLVTTGSKMREAASCYHYWIAQGKERAFEQLAPKTLLSLKIAETYRLNSYKATQEQRFDLAQYWAEAACLLQEAARKFSIAQQEHHHKIYNLLTDYWRTAAHAAYYAATLQAHVAKEASSLPKKELLWKWQEAAHWADDGMVLKANAARLLPKDEQLSITYSLAGYWTILAADIQVFVIKMSMQHLKLSLWEKALSATKNVSMARRKALQEDSSKHNSLSLDLIASLEDTADRLIILAENELE